MVTIVILKQHYIHVYIKCDNTRLHTCTCIKCDNTRLHTCTCIKCDNTTLHTCTCIKCDNTRLHTCTCIKCAYMYINDYNVTVIHIRWK